VGRVLEGGVEQSEVSKNGAPTKARLGNPGRGLIRRGDPLKGFRGGLEFVEMAWNKIRRKERKCKQKKGREAPDKL